MLRVVVAAAVLGVIATVVQTVGVPAVAFACESNEYENSDGQCILVPAGPVVWQRAARRNRAL